MGGESKDTRMYIGKTFLEDCGELLMSRCYNDNLEFTV